MKKALLAADCWLHGQVIVLCQQHFLLDHEQTSYTKHALLVS